MDQYIRKDVVLCRFKANIVPDEWMTVDISRPASDTWSHYTVTYLNLVGTGSDYLKVCIFVPLSYYLLHSTFVTSREY